MLAKLTIHVPISVQGFSAALKSEKITFFDIYSNGDRSGGSPKGSCVER